MQVDRHSPERPAPLHHGRVVVRMGDGARSPRRRQALNQVRKGRLGAEPKPIVVPRSIYMIDDDGIFHSILTGPDTMGMCRIEVTANSRIAGCRQLIRQR